MLDSVAAATAAAAGVRVLGDERRGAKLWREGNREGISLGGVLVVLNNWACSHSIT
jgi:hypothetical protein